VTVYVGNSAKITDGNEITPQTNHVTIFNNSSCEWFPRYDLSVTQCHIDITWFPFDEQTCQLVLESWTLNESVLKLKTYNEWANLKSFLKPDGWQLLGECTRY